MRPILILVILGILILPCRSFAETNSECQATCASEKTTRNANCASPGEDTDLTARTQCLQESHDAYTECLNSCPQSAPTDTTAEN